MWCIRRTKFPKYLKNRNILSQWQAFTMINNMASSDLWKILYLPNCTNCRWHQCCVMSGRWGAMQMTWQMVKSWNLWSALDMLGMWQMLCHLASMWHPFNSLMETCSPKNLTIQTSTIIVIATIIFLSSTVFITPSHRVKTVPTHSYCKRGRNMWRGPSKVQVSQLGTKQTHNQKQQPQCQITTTRITISMWWCPM